MAKPMMCPVLWLLEKIAGYLHVERRQNKIPQEQRLKEFVQCSLLSGEWVIVYKNPSCTIKL